MPASPSPAGKGVASTAFLLLHGRATRAIEGDPGYDVRHDPYRFDGRDVETVRRALDTLESIDLRLIAGTARFLAELAFESNLNQQVGGPVISQELDDPAYESAARIPGDRVGLITVDEVALGGPLVKGLELPEGARIIAAGSPDGPLTEADFDTALRAPAERSDSAAAAGTITHLVAEARSFAGGRFGQAEPVVANLLTRLADMLAQTAPKPRPQAPDPDPFLSDYAPYAETVALEDAGESYRQQGLPLYTNATPETTETNEQESDR